jgi:hypothetical protein
VISSVLRKATAPGVPTAFINVERTGLETTFPESMKGCYKLFNVTWKVQNS